MKIFGIELKRSKRKKGAPRFGVSQPKTEDKAPPTQTPKHLVSIAKIPRVRSPVLSFKLRSGIDEFEQSEYDMAEIGRIEDIESFVARAFAQKQGLMFKEGWELVGKNLNTIQYIKQRFEQIGMATGEPFSMVLKELGEDLIRYSNAFLVKVRNRKASGGKIRRSPNKATPVEPVAGYFALPVSTVRFKRDDSGKILKYKQVLPNGKYKEFNPEDVIHLYFRKKKGFLVGTPSLIPVKDDIRALRRIEENIEMLIYQHLFPLYHYKVGTEMAPAETYSDGTTEVDVAKREVEMMPAEGMVVTPERHDIKAIGAEGRALRAEGYLKHFKQRIFAGLGVSAVDMGEGDTANRSTADSMSRNMVDDVKHYQRTWEIFIDEYIIKELLLESTFDSPIENENLVYIKCNEIDIDAKIKVQNHAIASFAGYAITIDELRREFGKEPLTDEEFEKTFWKLIKEPTIMMQAIDEPYSPLAQAVARAASTATTKADLQQSANAKQKEIAATTKAKAAGKPGPKSTKTTSGQRSAQASNQPSNQHGTKTGPEKRKSSFNLADAVGEGNRVTKIYTNLHENIMYAIDKSTFSNEWFKQLVFAAREQMIDNLSRLLRIEFRNGFRSTKAVEEPGSFLFPLSVIDSRIRRIIGRFTETLIARVTKVVDPNDTPDTIKLRVSAVFDALKFRSRFIYNSEKNKARNYGIINGLAKLGHKEADITYDEGSCDLCKERAGRISTKHITIDDIPGHHPNCTCSIIAVEEQ